MLHNFFSDFLEKAIRSTSFLLNWQGTNRCTKRGRWAIFCTHLEQNLPRDIQISGFFVTLHGRGNKLWLCLQISMFDVAVQFLMTLASKLKRQWDSDFQLLVAPCHRRGRLMLWLCPSVHCPPSGKLMQFWATYVGGGISCPQDFFEIMQFAGNFKGNPPILSKFWAQGPLAIKLGRAPLTKILDPRLNLFTFFHLYFVIFGCFMPFWALFRFWLSFFTSLLLFQVFHAHLLSAGSTQSYGWSKVPHNAAKHSGLQKCWNNCFTETTKTVSSQKDAKNFTKYKMKAEQIGLCQSEDELVDKTWQCVPRLSPDWSELSKNSSFW